MQDFNLPTLQLTQRNPKDSIGKPSPSHFSLALHKPTEEVRRLFDKLNSKPKAEVELVMEQLE